MGVGWEHNTTGKTKPIKNKQWSKRQYNGTIKSPITGTEELEFKSGSPIY